MGELKLPQLWFARTHMGTESIFYDSFSDKNCLGWSTTPIKDLHTVALKRIAELNTKMPDQWRYELIGWRLDSKEHKNEAL